MTKRIVFISLLCIGFLANAQKTVFSKEYKLAFTVPNDLEKYDTESKNVLGYENPSETMAVDVEVFPISEWSNEYIESQKYAALDVGPLLSLKNSSIEGFVCPLIESSYSKLTYDYSENPKVPVFVVAILNKKAGLVYEATIYCYDLNIEKGKKVAQSFKLLD